MEDDCQIRVKRVAISSGTTDHTSTDHNLNLNLNLNMLQTSLQTTLCDD